MTQRRTRRVLGPVVASLLTISPLALAQAPDAEPLRGPQVEPRDAPGVDSPFVPNMSDPRMRAPRIPHRVFVEAIGSLASDVAPADLHPDARTSEQIRAIVREYRVSYRAYREEHAEEFEELQPERAQPMTRDQAQRRTPEQRRRLRALMEDAPKPDAAHARIWALLSEPQQQYVRARIDEAMARRRVQREGKSDEPINVEPRPMMPMERSDLDRMRFESIWIRIERLPPEARSRLLGRLEQGIDRIEADRVREDKPAPSINDIEIPPADDQDDPPARPD